MAFSSTGTAAVVASWVLAAFTFVFVVARAYTRVSLINMYAIDDHIYNAAFVFLIAYCITITIAAHYGFGQNMDDLLNPNNPDNKNKNISKAILLEAISQTFEIIGMVLAKCSLGTFLLRLVLRRWHVLVIWVGVCTLIASSVSTLFVFWLSCTPYEYLWDRTIPGGYCGVRTTPISLILSINCVLVDFTFAILPWVFIWNLQMGRREKTILLASLSFGVVAGACGIKRTLEISSLSSANYLKDTVGLIVWSCAELTVTMMCIGIAVCRPLYKNLIDKLTSYDRSSSSRKNKNRSAGAVSGGGGGGADPGAARYALHTFGGTTMVSAKNRSNRHRGGGKGGGDAGGDDNDDEEGIGMTIRDNESETMILRPQQQQQQQQYGGGQQGIGGNDGLDHGIRVTEEYEVTRV